MSRRNFSRMPALVAAVALVAGCAGQGPASGEQSASGQVTAQREIVSRTTGDPPNFAQCSNGSMMTVVSRDWGRGAKAGALVELYWPEYDSDNLWDAYVGVETADGLKWAHQMKRLRQAIRPDTGLVISEFELPGQRLVIEDVMWPDRDVHMRRATVVNTGTVPLRDAALAHHAFLTLGGLPTGDQVESRPGGIVQRDGAIAAAIVAFPAAANARVGRALQMLGDTKDARVAAEQGEWQGPRAAGPAAGGVTSATRHPLPALAPGQSASVTWAFGMAATDAQAFDAAQGALKEGFDGALRADAQRWARFLESSKIPAGLDAATLAVYRRALITMGQHATRAGALIAAPTHLNPPYRFVWPRDGSLSAITLLEAGHPDLARSFFTFAEGLQKPDGSFAVNYFPSGKRAFWDFGTRGNEHDEPATFVWGAVRYALEAGDEAWLRARYPAIRRSCDFLVAMQTEDGLLNTCRDLWELDTDGTWAYSNGSAWAAWLAGIRAAEKFGDAASAARWRSSVERMAQGMLTKMVAPEGGYLVRGIRKGRQDLTVEAANLALGAGTFQVLKDDHPVMRAMGDAVATRLRMPGGGIRRYEGDRYYDGHPWPVATSWLGRHQLARGDRAAAAAAIRQMTEWAQTTESLMLGEQFDTTNKRWISAFPLVWSEAAFIDLVLALHHP